MPMQNFHFNIESANHFIAGYTKGKKQRLCKNQYIDL
ncbi:hypothetical protein MCW_00007 [Cardidatus Bartonella washoeensis 085-0475]|uniref:Uncharacterized protein n=1 Tax=Cardidatus Bartonella washoeensis 085-0475 TaxID=1094564 RepID=J0QUH6_9HYPH|nr:hypothetical protein MCW_00007 [Bartonella washoeensis 085-0475]